MVKERIRIPTPLRRKLLIECGYQCSLHTCRDMNNLEAHHINGNPGDNRIENIIMLCPTHHTMADRGVIDRKACKMFKEMIKTQQPNQAEKILENIELIKNEIKQINKSSKSKSNSKRRTRK